MTNTVCFAIPSKRKPEECQSLLDKWVERGYHVVLRRLRSDAPHPTGCEIILRDSYEGWAASVNELSKIILNREPEVDWIVTGGDDYAPDPNHTADEIAEECSTHFYNSIECAYPPSRPDWSDIPIPSPGGSGRNAPSWKRWSTFGVMQPTGDRWGEQDENSRRMYPDAPALIDRICGSPWLGREFCLRMYGGSGPMFGNYKHMFADQELLDVAKHLGILCQRRDLTQIHHHWQRSVDGQCPDWLAWANTQEHWATSRALYHSRKSTEFPGHEPI